MTVLPDESSILPKKGTRQKCLIAKLPPTSIALFSPVTCHLTPNNPL